MTGRKLNTAWRAVVGIVCVAMLAFSVAVVGLWLKVTQLESQLAKEQRVSAALRQQTQELGQALRSCRQTHGRNCRRPARPTPTPQPPTAVASGAVTPAPRPTGSASAKPQPSRSPEPTRPPSASPSPSPSCVVSVSRICVTVRSPVPLTERPGRDRARHRTTTEPLLAVPPWCGCLCSWLTADLIAAFPSLRRMALGEQMTQPVNDDDYTDDAVSEELYNLPEPTDPSQVPPDEGDAGAAK